MFVVDDASLLASGEPSAAADAASGDGDCQNQQQRESTNSAVVSTGGGGTGTVETLTPRVLGTSKYRPLEAGSCILTAFSDVNPEAEAEAESRDANVVAAAHGTALSSADSAAIAHCTTSSSSNARPQTITRPSIEAFAKGIGAHELTVERPSESSGRFARLMCHLETLVRHTDARHPGAGGEEPTPRRLLFSPNTASRKRTATPRNRTPATSSSTVIPPHKRTKTE